MGKIERVSIKNNFLNEVSNIYLDSRYILLYTVIRKKIILYKNENNN